MHLGIDFGTTRTVVAVADRGNYPVVDFLDLDHDYHSHFPTVSALVDGKLVHGFAAQTAARSGARLIRSVKRHLADPDLTLESVIDVDGQQIALLHLVTSFFTALREALQQSSTLPEGEPIGAVVVGVPAHAHTAQRLLTLEAFRRAGFEVGAMLNEPSAAGFEYTHRQHRTVTSRRNCVLVYDLGGGTFDASLVSVENADHEVLGSVGINRLGGDDFDLLLADLVLEKAGVREQDLPERALDELVEQCREAKEGLTPQTRRLGVEVGDQMVALDVADFYRASTPLVEQSLQVMEPLVAGLDAAASDLAGLYLVGGSSGLPLVPRVLRERFGRRVRRSPLSRRLDRHWTGHCRRPGGGLHPHRAALPRLRRLPGGGCGARSALRRDPGAGPPGQRHRRGGGDPPLPCGAQHRVVPLRGVRAPRRCRTTRRGPVTAW